MKPQPLAWLFCLSLALALGPPAALGQKDVTVQKTRPKDIGPTSRSAKPPRPPAPGVTVRYTLKANSKTGELMLSAKFTNGGRNAQRFLFCQMVGTSTTSQTVKADCKLKFDAATNKVTCVAGSGSFSGFTNAYHFGCQLVEIPGGAGKMANIDYGSSGAQPGFVGNDADDFSVTYADYILMPPGATFDSSGCGACFGMNKNTSLTGELSALGDWYVPIMPFDDPYIRYQPITGAPPSPVEYRSFADNFAVPSDFPIDVPGLERNVPQPVPATYSIPIYLFDLYTMEARPGEVFPAQLSLETTGAPELELETFPAPGEEFEIQGGAEEFGELRITRVGAVEEGAAVEFEIAVHEPDRDAGQGAAYFAQHGSFVHDTVPPLVTSHAVVPLAQSVLMVEVTASDATSGPLAASLWFSLDGGASWEVEPLASTSNVLEDDALVRTFKGEIGVGGAAQVQYFITVQDTVFNQTFFGVGSVQVQQQPAEKPVNQPLRNATGRQRD